MNTPENLVYASSHEWFDKASNRVGISDFAQDQLGDVVYIDVSVSVGDDVAKGDSLGTIESVKTVSDLYAPVSGKVTAVNEGIEGSEDLVNSEPYGGGWLFEVTPSNDEEVAQLLSAADYAAQTSE